MLDDQLGEPTIQSACSLWAVSAWSAFLMPFLPFVYGYPSSSPHAHCTPNKSVPTLNYTHRHGPIYTGPCPKALTKCSPLDFRRLSIKPLCKKKRVNLKGPKVQKQVVGLKKVENVKRFPPAQFHLAVLSVFIQKRTFYCLQFELFVAPPKNSRKVCSQGICYLFSPSLDLFMTS